MKMNQHRNKRGAHMQRTLMKKITKQPRLKNVAYSPSLVHLNHDQSKWFSSLCHIV